MDKLILGLLMIKSFTVYEIRQVMRQNFSSMCSDSLGKYPSSLKKTVPARSSDLFGVRRKRKNEEEYAITASGRILFLEWLKTPINMSKNKNMDLGKFLFMVYLPKREQLQMLDLTIEGLEVEVQEFEAVKASIQFAEEQQQVQAYLEQHDHLATELLEVSQTANLTESISQLGYFEMKTLEFGLDSARFQLNWFTDLRKQLSEKDGEK